MSGEADDFLDRLFSDDQVEAPAASSNAVNPPPARRNPQGDLDVLLDNVFERCGDPGTYPDLRDLLEPLREFDRERLTAALDRRIGDPPNGLAEGISLRLLLELGPVTEGALRRQWAAVTLDSAEDVARMPRLARESIPILGAAPTLAFVLETLTRLNWPAARPDALAPYFALPFAFSHGLKDALPAQKLLDFVLALMNRLPPGKLAGNVLHALCSFQDPRVLDWMESHAAEPITYEWGTAAAVSGLSWDRVRDWLDRGPPLSLIALDAMKNCRGFDPGDPEMSGIFKVISPRILRPAPRKKMRKTLEAFARKDPSPRVQRAVELIVANLPRIAGE